MTKIPFFFDCSGHLSREVVEAMSNSALEMVKSMRSRMITIRIPRKARGRKKVLKRILIIDDGLSEGITRKQRSIRALDTRSRVIFKT